ncbi:MAG: hypothetical protein ABJD97_22435, partial [Betaproteobacteria bacterium]
RRKPALMLAVALVIPVYEASASLKMPARVRQQSQAQAALRATEPPGGWEKAVMSPTDRTALSTNAAMINYLVLGRRESLIDAAGNRVLFNPTQELMHTREQFVRDEKGAEDVGQQFFERGVRLFANAAMFLLVGAIVGWRQRIAARRAAA